MRRCTKDVTHTWNDQSLAAHDENNLHWSELLQPELPPFIQGETQLRDENSTEETDADRRCNICGTSEPSEGREVFCRNDVL